MKNKSNLLILAFSLVISVSYSQKKFMDYIVNETNDTIYGVIRNVNSSKPCLLEKKQTTNNSDQKFESHKLENIKSFRYNDKIYYFEKPKELDGIYASQVESDNNDSIVTEKISNFKCTKTRLKDYVVNLKGDTIYGKIKQPFLGIHYLLSEAGKKFKIKKDVVKSYRFENKEFMYLNKPQVDIFDNTSDYLRLIIGNNNVRLFEYTRQTGGAGVVGMPNMPVNNISNPSLSFSSGGKSNYYFIEKNNTLILVKSNSDFKKNLQEIFFDNAALVSLIADETYTMENLYLMVKFYNSN